jgi:membrane protease YdiL (CAAX protease family)
MPNPSARKRRLPVEMAQVGAGACAFAAVVAMGAGLSSAIPAPAPWLTAAAWLAPAGLAFAAWWWATQRS